MQQAELKLLALRSFKQQFAINHRAQLAQNFSCAQHHYSNSNSSSNSCSGCKQCASLKLELFKKQKFFSKQGKQAIAKDGKRFAIYNGGNYCYMISAL